MAESTASLKLTDLQGELGFFIGFGRGDNFGDPIWAMNQIASITSCVASGLHKFYFPPVLPGDSKAHEWSFLKPVAMLTLLPGQNAIVLPPDFGGLSGELTLSTPTGQRMSPVPIVAVGKIDRWRALNAETNGMPRMAAIQPLKGTSRERGQQFELALYPTADVEYTFEMAYTLAPNVLTASHPYPYGGPVHRETILESCLAVAESRLDDQATTHSQLFMQQLMSSVSHDRKYRPQLLGYNGNNRWENPRNYQYDFRLVTIDGQHS